METTNNDAGDKSEQLSEKYMGPFKVLGLEMHPTLKTPLGKDVVYVLYESGEKQMMPVEAFKALVTDEPTDFTSLGDRRAALIRDEIVKTLLEWDATAFELQTILQKVSNKLSNVYDKVAHLLFTREIYGEAKEKTWVPGSNFAHYRTLMECDSILKKIDTNQDNATNISDK